ncbi:putative heat shock 70 kDa protein 7 [Orchesella cincta]|uniref:Putative heat shock 70 kDa protein 7 n=1 Tax=Orchesella cincta TaxID=48709 RepID=A0A1D2NAI2_ORCCI|nr:putative heat shock 70 kDa protein 7 [Orchesella cincta]
MEAWQKKIIVSNLDKLISATNCTVTFLTKFQAIGVLHEDDLEVLVDRSTNIPSYVTIQPDGSKIVGLPAKKLSYRNPENTVYDIKRIIGRQITDPILNENTKHWPFKIIEQVGVPKIQIHEKLYHPEEILSFLLMEIKNVAESFLRRKPGSIKKAVITVPAYFTDGQRQATIDACELAGLQVLTITNEYVAAAITYSHKKIYKKVKNGLLLDLGGGTFEAAVLQIDAEKINVLGVDGDSCLGDLFERVIMILKQTLKIARLESEQIDDIMLLGGSSRIPKVREILGNYFKKRCINDSIIPDQAVAYGAAVYAAMLLGNAHDNFKLPKINNVCTMSVGTKSMTNEYFIIVHKNAIIPFKVTREYIMDNKTELQLKIYEVDKENPSKTSLLGNFTISGIPPAPTNEETIEVTMLINEMGIFHMEATLKGNKNRASKPLRVLQQKNRMSKEEIRRILQKHGVKQENQ